MVQQLGGLWSRWLQIVFIPEWFGIGFWKTYTHCVWGQWWSGRQYFWEQLIIVFGENKCLFLVMWVEMMIWWMNDEHVCFSLIQLSLPNSMLLKMVIVCMVKYWIWLLTGAASQFGQQCIKEGFTGWSGHIITLLNWIVLHWPENRYTVMSHRM